MQIGNTEQHKTRVVDLKAGKTEGRKTRIDLFILCAVLSILFAGCATTDETSQLRRSVGSLENEVLQLRQETDAKMSKISKENEATSKQVVNMYSLMESKDEKIKDLMGKIDELEYQLRTYWTETKSALAAAKKPDDKSLNQTTQGQKPGPQQPKDVKYEDAYKDAFETFQKGKYDEAVKMFSTFIDSYSGTPLVSNAYYWIGESYMNLKNYDKAILYFQETIDKYPKSEKAPRALLSQAEAFRLTNDKKSSTTILKRVIELYPKTEEAIIAERRLRNSSL
jgi:tol-pal system protein YbgF